MKTNKNFRSNHFDIIIKTFTIFLIMIYILTFHILPSCYSVTIEEQAGTREDRPSRSGDEFTKKAAERRDSKGQVQERDPRLACMLSLIIPGGGQIYLREDIKGIGFCLLAGTGYAVSGYFMYKALFGGYSGAEKRSKMIISALFFLVGAIIHVVGIVEAYNSAIEINEKRYYYGDKKSNSPFVAELLLE